MKTPWSRLLILLWICSGFGGARAETNASPAGAADFSGLKALSVLRDTFAHEKRSARLSAAESLISLGYPQEVDKVLQAEIPSRGNDPVYRIGLWLNLAQSSDSELERNKWIAQIRQIFLDPTAPDRVEAIRALGKLGYTIQTRGDEEFERAARSGEDELPINARWVLIHSGSIALANELAAILESGNPGHCREAAQVLSQLPDLPSEARKSLLTMAEKQPKNSAARAAILSAAFVVADPAEKKPLEEELLQYLRTGGADEKEEACSALAMAGDSHALSELRPLMADAVTGVRAGAALATLRIGRRVPHHLNPLDWAVIGAYGLSMLLIGSYYARRNKTADDYLLGGRQMKPTTVGISLFASLLSAIGYLANPGEMIKYGPILFSSIAAYPFVVILVGKYLIPPFMKLPAASGYEILELRLGVNVRILGALFFLSLRLLWMAVIIYATTDKVLIPLTGLNPAFKPLVCLAIGIVTIVYTSAGGLRAVVFTDVAQTCILLLGAILTLAVVTKDMGSVRAWWPTHWYDNWAEPKFWFDSTGRTFAGSFLATFVWYFCTCGSDQMAIQRYLATRDVKAARSVLAVSMTTDALVTTFLGVLGLALLGYFRAHPEMIPDGGTIRSSADRLFPQFIAIGLPIGISGLVIAALFAAAMSALASGLNSTSTVIVVDFLNRFRRVKSTAAAQVRLNRKVSILVGALVVTLSLFVGVVPGNLIEICYRVINILVAPLFVLFLMAVFVPWATSFGTIVGGLGSVAVAVGISFFHLLNLDFLWIMPGSLIAGAAIGMIASLLPLSKKSTLRATITP